MKKPFFGGVIASLSAKTPDELFKLLPLARMATSREIRFDTLGPDVHFIFPQLATCITDQQTILTYRSVQDGGKAPVSYGEQCMFWGSLGDDLTRAIADPDSKVFVDIDINFMTYLQFEGKELPFPMTKVGCSRHNWKSTPTNLTQQLKELGETPARAFLKFVTTATRYTDVILIETLLDRYHGPIPLIAFAMGEQGQDSRFTCMRYRSSGTYGYIRGHQPAAPGQIPIDVLLEHPDVREALARN